MLKLTVIVSNYNNAPYLNQLLTSLKNSIGQVFQIFFVDDCSSDNSLLIVDKFRRENPTIPFKLIQHEKNLGLGATRNSGLSLVDTEYVTFIDSDDFVPPGGIDAMMSVIDRGGGVSVVSGGVVCVDEKGIYLNKLGSIQKVRVIDYKKDIRYILGGTRVSAWGRIYRTNVLKTIVRKYPNGYYEDVIPYIKLIRGKVKWIEIPDVVYCWRQLPNSLSHKKPNIESIDSYIKYIRENFSLSDSLYFISKTFYWYARSEELERYYKNVLCEIAKERRGVLSLFRIPRFVADLFLELYGVRTFSSGIVKRLQFIWLFFGLQKK